MKPVRGADLRNGWTWLALETVSRMYLVGTMTLVVIAVLPVVLGWQAHVIRSGSMEPHIGVGDVVLTSSVPDSAPPPVGRVVTFTNPAAADPSGAETTRMHRIVSAIDGHTFITAGDANRDVDSTPIDRDQITGQGRLLIPWIGSPSNWIAAGAIGKLVAWLALSAAAIVFAGSSVSRRRNSHDPPPGDTAAEDSLDDTSARAAPAVAPAHREARLAHRRAGGLAIVTAVAVPLLVVISATVVSTESVQATDAAFTATTRNSGNSFSVAVNQSMAKSTYQVYDTPGGGGWYQRSAVTVNLSATAQRGNVSSITYRLNGGAAVVTQHSSVTFTLNQQGDNTLTYFATDDKGNDEIPHTVHVKLDVQQPTFSVTSRTGTMSHAQWAGACPTLAPTGGLCGDTNDTASGVSAVAYTLFRSSDGTCFDGSRWSRSACSTQQKASLVPGRWFVSVPDAQLRRARGYYTVNFVVSDVAGNGTYRTATFSVG